MTDYFNPPCSSSTSSSNAMILCANSDKITSLNRKLEELQVKMQLRLEEGKELEPVQVCMIQSIMKQMTDVASYLGISLSTNAADHNITGSSQACEIVNGSSAGAKPLRGEISNETVHLLEKVKVLVTEITTATIIVRRLVVLSADNPQSSKTQIDKLEREIEEKKREMSILEKLITEITSASVYYASLVDREQELMRLKTNIQLMTKSEEIRTIQKQLQCKVVENEILKLEKFQAVREKEKVGCKVCFDSQTATMLLPCRHFGLCKACSLACLEYPFCRAKIEDRIDAFTC